MNGGIIPVYNHRINRHGELTIRRVDPFRVRDDPQGVCLPVAARLQLISRRCGFRSRRVEHIRRGNHKGGLRLPLFEHVNAAVLPWGQRHALHLQLKLIAVGCLRLLDDDVFLHAGRRHDILQVRIHEDVVVPHLRSQLRQLQRILRFRRVGRLTRHLILLR